jgi:uncharacterized protein (DUF1697 family)
MTRYAGLLRAVNVGGRKVEMAALRRLMGELGFGDVVTYIQSGNLVFTGPKRPEAKIAAMVEERILADLGVPTRLLVRTGPELADAVRDHPFAKPGVPHNQLHVVFLAVAPAASLVAALRPPDGERVQFRVAGREVYGYYPDGSGNSKVTLPFFERGLKTIGTARNLNTVMKLAAMTAQAG